MQGVWVQSLVEELRSHVLYGVAKKEEDYSFSLHFTFAREAARSGVFLKVWGHF